jgi:hypothetical protein
MDRQIRAVIVSVGIVFAVVFAGMTFVALGTAELNFASILAFGFSFLIIFLILIGVIGVIRNPPDED